MINQSISNHFFYFSISSMSPFLNGFNPDSFVKMLRLDVCKPIHLHISFLCRILVLKISFKDTFTKM